MTENRRKVVVTGIGILTPWGRGISLFWENLLAGKPVFKEVSVNTTPLPSKLGGEISEFNYEKSNPLFERGNKFCKLSTIAGEDAVKDAKLSPSKQDFSKIGIIGGTALGYPTIKQYGDMLDPIKSQYIYSHVAVGLICVRNKVKGPTFTICSGEASGSYAVGWGLEFIRSGRCNIVIAGASDVLSRTAYLHYASLEELSPIVEAEEKCVPFDKERNGLILSEAAAYLILEEVDHAKARGANIYGEIAGYGSSHDTDSSLGGIDPTGKNLELAMEYALQDSLLGKIDIDAIYAAANGSKKLDAAEATSIKNLFRNRLKDVSVSSIKSIAGESLSAGGILNIIAALFTINQDLIIPIVGFEKADQELDLNYVSNSPRRAEIKKVMCNSVSYGGNNVSLIVRGI